MLAVSIPAISRGHTRPGHDHCAVYPRSIGTVKSGDKHHLALESFHGSLPFGCSPSQPHGLGHGKWSQWRTQCEPWRGMETDSPATTADTSPRLFGSGRTISTRSPYLLLGLIVLLLAALVIVPILVGRRTDMLRNRRAELVFPAQHALQETRSLLTEQLAAARGYQISGDAHHLTLLEEALLHEQEVADRLLTLAREIGAETLSSVKDFQALITDWQQAPRALVAGAITRDELIAALDLGQDRFESALRAADDVRATLNTRDVELESRIGDVARLERFVTVLLSLIALAAALAMVWLTRRLHSVTRQLEEGAEGLRVSEERFRLIAENLREMIWISDPAYTVQYYLSPAYERIWGRSVQEARTNPRSFLQAVVPQDRERVESALEGYARGEYAAEYRITRADGEIRWISGRAYPVRDEHERIFLIAGIAEDITSQKQIEQEREHVLERERRAHSETEAALQLRDRVVRVVSHDLKNPLHTIGMATELLEMPLPEEERTKQISVIRRTVARANRMVSDLLDAARLESGRAIAIARTPLELQPLVSEAVEAFHFQVQEKNQQLTCEIAGGMPSVLGDHDRLIQALSNLLGNAVKFTPEGGRIRVVAQPDTDGDVRICVSDTGRGIPADVVPHLFEPFTQARDTASLGTGLGLAITHGIVEAHGGTISVESEPGSGTTFTFTLPSYRAPGGLPFDQTSELDETVKARKRRKLDAQTVRDDVDAATSDQKSAPPLEEGPKVYTDPVDDTLDDTFPASDPPPWWGR